MPSAMEQIEIKKRQKKKEKSFATDASHVSYPVKQAESRNENEIWWKNTTKSNHHGGWYEVITFSFAHM
jgi:hypothetical protein